MPFAEAGFEVTGVDGSNAGIQRARQRLGDSLNVTLVDDNLEQNEFDSEFDVVVCDYVFAHLENQLDIEFLAEDAPSFSNGKELWRTASLRVGRLLAFELSHRA